MNRILALSLAVLVAAFSAGCSGAQSGNPSSGDDSAAPAPESPASEAAPPPAAVYPSVLTGLPVPGAEVAGTRIAAVVVDNNSRTHGFQHGLSQAGVLAEVPVEGGITRFLAFYEDYAAMPTVGPVRSSRDGFLQLAMPFQPLFVCAGGSTMHTWYADAFQQHERIFGDVAQRMPELLPEAESTVGEYAWFADGGLLAAAVEAGGVDDTRAYSSGFFQFLPFGAPARTPSGGDAEAMKIVFSEKYQTYFDYDSVAQRYLMSRSNSATGADRVPATDAGNNEARLAFDNVLVLFAEMPAYEDTNGLLDIRFGNGGAGFYFSGGGWQKVRWQKDSPQHPLRLTDAGDGEALIEMNPGTTYLALVDVEQAARFSFGPHGGEITLRERET